MANISRWAVLPVAAALIAGCAVPETATDLRPEGPPMVQQVFLSELTNNNGVLRRIDGVAAFGWHPDVTNLSNRPDSGEADDRTHPVTTAIAASQTIRIVLDELLIGNSLEEISCRDGSWSRVPEGATPDDIAACTVPTDLLPRFCVGEMRTCIGPDGEPVGVLDEDENGSADDTRLACNSSESETWCTDGPVRLRCNDIYVQLDRQKTFWQPAGNQLVPAGQVPHSSLGPAIIVVPMNDRLPTQPGLLPPGATCRFEFAPDVTDKNYNRICAPTGGVEGTEDIGDCTEGDVAAFSFGTEAVRRDSSSPSRGATNVSITRRSTYIELSAPVDPDSLAAATVVVMQGATVRTDVTVDVNPEARINFTLAADMIPNTMYTISITGLRDIFGQPIAGTFDNTFTTAP